MRTNRRTVPNRSQQRTEAEERLFDPGPPLHRPAWIRPTYMPRHPTVSLWYEAPPAAELDLLGRQSCWVDIDVDIAPLILELWRAGIDTTNSCQGPPTYSRTIICFGAPADCRHFMRIMLTGRRHMPGRRPVEADRWTGRDWYEAAHFAGNQNASVSFPFEDVAEVEARVRWHNRRQGEGRFPPGLNAGSVTPPPSLCVLGRKFRGSPDTARLEEVPLETA